MPSLRTTLLIDSVVCFVCGAVLWLAVGPLSTAFVSNAVSWFGYSTEDVLRFLGAGVLGVGLYVYAIAYSKPISPIAVWPVIAVEMGWLAGSLLLLVWAGHAFSWLGTAVVVAGAVAVFGFMVLELMGLQSLSNATSEVSRQME